MKIGTITFHCSYNFGSALQAWAMKRALERMGHEVHVVDYRGRDFEQYRLFDHSSGKALMASVLLARRNRRRSKAFEGFIEREFSCTDRFTWRDERQMERLAGEFDCFICGSDQIWNLDCTHGPVGPYFLSFAGTCKRVAYAPSLAHEAFEAENFGSAERAQIAEWLRAFDAVSVREASTIPLFAELSGRSIEACVDPTLLLDAEDYRGILLPMPDAHGKLFVYMLEWNRDLVAYAAALARLLGAEIAYVSRRPLSFGVPATNLYGIGPSEFLGYIEGCAAVLTNSFHATVFSILLGTPFQTFATARSGSRMRELLGNLDASDHLAESGSPSAPQAVCAETVSPRLEALRADSLAFLRGALTEA